MRRAMLLVVIAAVSIGCNSLEDADELGASECSVYCNIMEENCDLVYQGDRERCLDDCDQFKFNPQTNSNGELIPYGQRVEDDDSYECRIYHLDTALDGPPNNSHCEEASPSGAGTCVRPGTDPDCALLCHGAVYGCGLTLEDYLNCERDCEDATTIERDSIEFRCREGIARRARETKNEDDADPERPVCQVVRDVFVRDESCVESAEALPGFTPL